MELIPVLQFPVMSRIGFVWPLVFIMYGLYWYLGFKTKGFFGYFRSWIPQAPWPILIILIPVEILKYVVVQPFTLGVRLFANMFAGHLLLTIFMVATWYMTSLSDRPAATPPARCSWCSSSSCSSSSSTSCRRSSSPR